MLDAITIGTATEYRITPRRQSLLRVLFSTFFPSYSVFCSHTCMPAPTNRTTIARAVTREAQKAMKLGVFFTKMNDSQPVKRALTRKKRRRRSCRS